MGADNPDCESEATMGNSRTCEAVKNRYCTISVSLVVNQIASVVRTCDDTCERDDTSCLNNEYGTCITCCQKDNCNNAAVANLLRLLSVSPTSQNSISELSTTSTESINGSSNIAASSSDGFSNRVLLSLYMIPFFILYSDLK
uniref:Uncharacterized protein LOC102809524 n=1 Tax=Saccoglossus kowalevskii TaxID=10224 RepID=A0ABM0MCY6_SACKO|nr:PREDICTED: uncharacterized protein LOC102809524 [Saccoglossus kowalevskii]